MNDPNMNFQKIQENINWYKSSQKLMTFSNIAWKFVSWKLEDVKAFDFSRNNDWAQYHRAALSSKILLNNCLLSRNEQGTSQYLYDMVI